MIRLHETIVVERTLEDCYRYLLDFSTSEQWDPGVYRAEKLTAGAPAVGTEFDLLLNSAGRHVPMRYTLKEASGNCIRLLGEGPGFSADDTITLRDCENGKTEIDYVAELSFSGPAGRVEGLLRPWLNRVGRKALAGLKTALTRADTAPVQTASQRLAHRLVFPAMPSFTRRGYLAMPDKGLSERVDGKVFAITGPTSGLGLATACALSRLGARLVLVGRDPSRLEAAREEVLAFSGAPASSIDLLEAELSLVSEARRAGEILCRRYPALDGLINNAGALFAERGETEEGHERALAVLLLAPYVLTQVAMPSLKAAGGHVINVSSGGMYTQPLRLDDMEYRQGDYDGAKAYARAKRGLVAVTEYWARIHPSVRFNSMHPGWAATPGVAKSLPTFNRLLEKRLRDSRMGADTIIWLATARCVEDCSGLFWFDRRPRPTAVLPGTAVSSDQQARLIEYLAQTCAV
jgi:NAD(P)-dependent dehydrogenase (short-subunit alcohol dehydrogenase family)